ncbi:MAG: hypothetical protein ACK5NG_02470, partial [Chthoniobacterales bacterium]
MILRVSLFLLFLNLPVPIRAQTPPPASDESIPRAEAVTPRDPNAPTPAWMQRVEPAAPGSTQAAIRPEPGATPYRP